MFFRVGDRVGGRFEVKKILGRGGVGVVYQVFDAERGKEVALKVLLPEVAKNELAMDRFMREVETMEKINHPGVVPVYDTGWIEGAMFFTMEKVEGDSIAALLEREGRLHVKAAVSIMIRAFEVMQRIHEVAVHRDISSDNIMVDVEGNVRILDFGTARVPLQSSTLTQTGLHLGKICYSAPEQRDDSKRVDHRADVYSLAIVLFEMLTGERLLIPEPVTNYLPELDKGWDAFFDKALQQAPEQRFDSVASMQQALEALA